MAFASPHPLETRRAVEALLHRNDLSLREIAARAGVSYGTVKSWNQQARIRPRTRAAGLDVDPKSWTSGRRAAAARLFGRGDIDPGDLAEALGSRHGDAPALMLACGLAAAGPATGPAPPGDIPDLAELGAALRTHIARQIAAFDEGLRRADAATDSAKVLRDLGGLKRLLDDLAASARRPDCDGDADGGSPQELAALREDLARRIEAFGGGRHDAGPAGRPDAPSAQGVVP